MQPAITTTGELRPLLLCKLMILTCVTSGGISGVAITSFKEVSSSAGVVRRRQIENKGAKIVEAFDGVGKPALYKIGSVVIAVGTAEFGKLRLDTAKRSARWLV